MWGRTNSGELWTGPAGPAPKLCSMQEFMQHDCDTSEVGPSVKAMQGAAAPAPCHPNSAPHALLVPQVHSGRLVVLHAMFNSVGQHS